MLAVVTLSCLINGTNAAMEAARSDSIVNMKAEWLFEISSHISILIVCALIPFALSRYPLTPRNTLSRLPVVAGVFLIFTTLHIILMVAMRAVIYPLIATGPYDFGLLRFEPWIYEMRKDLMTFLLIGSAFLTTRQFAYLKQEVRENTLEAKESGRISLRCGGRSLHLPAGEIRYARAAGNYVEIFTDSGGHLARITLSGLRDLLSAAGDGHIQLHRSVIARRADIREIIPTGGGEAKAVLASGEELAVSRRYRDSF